MIISPMIIVGVSLPSDWIEIWQLCSACALAAVGLFLAVHLDVIQFQVTPAMPSDPTRIVELFQGTSIGEMKRRQLVLKKSVTGVGYEISEPAGTESLSNLGKCGDSPSNRSLTQPLLKEKHRAKQRAVAPFRLQKRRPCVGADGRRPFWIRRLGGRPGYVPNPQERLYLFEEKGLVLMKGLIECVMFLQAVLVATLIGSYFVQPIESTLEVVVYCLAWAEWPVMLFWMVPRIVSRICILSSVEYEKDRDSIQRVTQAVKAQRVTEALRMIRIVKLRSRVGRTKGSLMTALDFEERLVKFNHLPGDQRREIESWFQVFDVDSSGYITVMEIKALFRSLGIPEVEQSAKDLVQLVDRDGDNKINIEEFRVMALLALQKGSAENEAEDLANLLRTFDADNDGTVALEELCSFFNNMGMRLDVDDLGTLVFNCFKEVKMRLTPRSS